MLNGDTHREGGQSVLLMEDQVDGPLCNLGLHIPILLRYKSTGFESRIQNTAPALKINDHEIRQGVGVRLRPGVEAQVSVYPFDI